MKMYEIQPFKAMWIDLDNIILSENCQKEKDRQYVALLICGI